MSAPGADGASTSKRRRTSDPGWPSLPEDLVRLVASRVLAGDLLDYVRFRAVCPRWRSGTDSPRGRGVSDPRFHPRRWMMLPEGHGLYPGHADLGSYACFLNLDTGLLVRSRIPLLGDHCAIDSVDGLLLLLRDLYNQSAVRLLHPFTGDVTELPPLGTLLPQLGTRLLSCPAPYRVKKALNNRLCCCFLRHRSHHHHAGASSVTPSSLRYFLGRPMDSVKLGIPNKQPTFLIQRQAVHRAYSPFMWRKHTPGSPD
uniref:F-box domain-containing protein n=1 Tax=Arundo donax TaxID=35708 RepID=A0A0A9DIU2_ARUDO